MRRPEKNTIGTRCDFYSHSMAAMKEGTQSVGGNASPPFLSQGANVEAENIVDGKR